MSITKASLIDLNGQELILDADADTSITADTDDQIDIKIAGSDSIRIKANEIENVSGDLTLDVAGDIFLDADGGQVYFQDGGTLHASIDMTGGVIFRNHVSDADIFIQGNDGGSTINMLSFDTSAAGKATFNAGIVVNESGGDNNTRFEGDSKTSLFEIDASTDRIGIGISSPSSMLHLYDGGSDTGITVQSQVAANATASVTLMSRDSSNVNHNSTLTAAGGNFTVATTKQIFSGTAGTSPIFEMINNDNEDNDTGRETSLRFSGHRSGGEDVINGQISGHHHGSADDDDGMMMFSVNTGSAVVEHLRITPFNVVVNDPANDHDFRVEGSGNANLLLVDSGETAVRIGASADVLGSSEIFTVNGQIGHKGPATNSYLLSTSTADGSSSVFMRFYVASGSTQVGSIDYSGTATRYNTSSDERLKENIKDSEDVGSKLDQIQVRQFDWKATNLHQDYGVVAQELIKVFPETISQGEEEEAMMSVDYSKLVPMLVKEIQSLRNRLAKLEGE